MHTEDQRGFSLIELLLVLAIIGILSGIAIPAFLGQRKRAKVIGDAQANARTLMMALEARKAENGVYGPKGTTTWTYNNNTPTGSNIAPTFSPKGNTKMNYSVAVGSTGVTYVLTVTDPFMASATVLTGSQGGGIALNSGYNK